MSAALTPTEELLMEVLAARTRTGEPFWTFGYRHRATLNRLEAKGLIHLAPAVTPHIEAHLTEKGREACLSPGYVPTGAKVEWGVKTEDDRKPIHYVLRSISQDGSEEYHRKYASRHDGELYRRAVIVLPWEQVPLEVTE